MIVAILQVQINIISVFGLKMCRIHFGFLNLLDLLSIEFSIHKYYYFTLHYSVQKRDKTSSTKSPKSCIKLSSMYYTSIIPLREKSSRCQIGKLA